MITQDLTREKLIRTNNNMDAVRYVLALIVFVCHYNNLAGTTFNHIINGDLTVAMFFTLSGFLVFDSYERRPQARRYIRSRARRILPPYIFIVLLCAVGLSAVSTLPAWDYFGSGQWWRYTAVNLCFLNFLEPCLPGVFTGGEMMEPYVNGSLWTMKVEWFLFLSVPLTAWVIARLSGRRSVRNAVIIAVILLSILYRWMFQIAFEHTGNQLYSILGRQFFGQMSFFYIGALLRTYLSAFLNYRWVMAVVITALITVTIVVPDTYLFLTPFAYSGLVIWVSMVGRWGRYVSRHDNVSYDIYLFHYPVIQLGVFFGLRTIGALPGLLIAIGATVALAFASWNLVGRRFAGRKGAATRT